MEEISSHYTGACFMRACAVAKSTILCPSDHVCFTAMLGPRRLNAAMFASCGVARFPSLCLAAGVTWNSMPGLDWDVRLTGWQATLGSLSMFCSASMLDWVWTVGWTGLPVLWNLAIFSVETWEDLADWEDYRLATIAVTWNWWHLGPGRSKKSSEFPYLGSFQLSSGVWCGHNTSVPKNCRHDVCCWLHVPQIWHSLRRSNLGLKWAQLMDMKSQENNLAAKEVRDWYIMLKYD